MGIFSRKPSEPLHILTIDQVKAQLGIPAKTYLHNVDGLYSYKLESCTLPDDPNGWVPCILVNNGNGANCLVQGKLVGVVRRQARLGVTATLARFGGRRAPGILGLTKPWSVYVDLRTTRPLTTDDD
jgi:hypothetical protein